MTCSCSDPRCPNARQFNACNHCMCLTEPNFTPNSTIGYAGPIYKRCCKCAYQVQIGGVSSITA